MARRHDLRSQIRATARMLTDTKERDPLRGGDAAPIVLLHGFGASRWVLRPMALYLGKRLGRPVLRPRLGGAFPLHLGDVRDTALRLQAEIEAWTSAADVPTVDLVGHSLGGLVATYLLKALDRGRRVRRVVTLGTPHEGTWAAVPGALCFGLFSRAVWQMIPGSSLLGELSRLPVPAGSRLIALASDGDAIVPASSTALADVPGVSRIHVAGVGHVDFLNSRTAFRAVHGALAA